MWHVTLWNNKVPHCNVGYDEFMHGNGQSPKVAHMRKAYGTIRQPKKSRNTLYKTLVQKPNVEHCREDYREGSGENCGP